MKDELNELLNEIEQIITKVAAFDKEEIRFSYKERNDLTRLFHHKINQVKALKRRSLVSLAS